MTKYSLTPVINNVRPITHPARGPLLPAPRSEEAQRGMKAIFKIRFRICFSEQGTTGEEPGKGFHQCFFPLVPQAQPHTISRENREPKAIMFCITVSRISWITGWLSPCSWNWETSTVILCVCPVGCFSPIDQDFLQERAGAVPLSGLGAVEVSRGMWLARGTHRLVCIFRRAPGHPATSPSRSRIAPKPP